MAQFKPILTTEANVNTTDIPIEAGQLIFSTDTCNIYTDNAEENRISLNIFKYYLDRNNNKKGVIGNGENIAATGVSSFATGYSTNAEGSHSIATGNGTTAEGDYSVTAGQNNLVEGDYSASIGLANRADGDYAFSCGYYNNALYDYSFAAGKNNNTSAEGQVVVGQYSADNSNSYFVVGAGTGENQRRNIFEVGSNYININGSLKINNNDAVFGQVIQKTIFEVAASSNVGEIYQYVGDNSSNWRNGYYYKSTYNSLLSTHSWQQLDVQPRTSMTSLFDGVSSTSENNALISSIEGFDMILIIASHIGTVDVLSTNYYTSSLLLPSILISAGYSTKSLYLCGGDNDASVQLHFINGTTFEILNTSGGLAITNIYGINY